VRQWELVAQPQHCPRPLSLHHRRLSRRRRPHRLQRPLRLLQRRPVDQSIHSIALLVPRAHGERTKSRGAAEFTTAVARRPHLHQCRLHLHRCRLHLHLCRSCHQCSLLFHPGLPIRTIAMMGSRIGRQVGVCRRRSGAAAFMARDAQTRAAVAHQWQRHPSPMIAMQDLPIGCKVGVSPRRRGVVLTEGRDALQQLVDVPDFDHRYVGFQGLAFQPGALALNFRPIASS